MGNETELALYLEARDRASKVFNEVSNNATSSFGSMKGSLSVWDAAAKKAVGTLLKFSAAAGALAAIVGVISFKIGKDFQYSLASVGAVAGATNTEMDKLRETARSIGATTAFSSKEAADAMYNLASAGLKVTEIMGAAEHAVKLAGATAGDMSQATSIMSSALKIFNINASDSSRVADVFAKTVSKSKFTLDGLTNAMKYAGPIGGALGWTIEETAAAVAQFAEIGLEATQTGTQLRAGMVQLLNPSEQVTSTLKALGVAWKDLNPETKTFDQIVDRLADTTMGATEAVKVFGTEAGGSFAKIIQNARQGSIDIKGFTTMLENSAGTSSEMYARMMDTVQGKWDELKSAVSAIFIDIFYSYSDQVKGMLATSTEFIGSLREIFGQISPVITMVAEYISQMSMQAVAAFGLFSGNFKITGSETQSVALIIIDTITALGSMFIKTFETMEKGALYYAQTMAKIFGQDTEKSQAVIDNIGWMSDAWTSWSDNARAAAISIANAQAETASAVEETTQPMIDNLIALRDTHTAMVDETIEKEREKAEALLETRTKAMTDELTLMQQQMEGELALLQKHGLDTSKTQQFWDQKIGAYKQQAREQQLKEQQEAYEKEHALQIEMQEKAIELAEGALSAIIMKEQTAAEAVHSIIMSMTKSLVDLLLKQAIASIIAAGARSMHNIFMAGAALAATAVVVGQIKQMFPKMAKGGIVTSEQTVTVGEAGPEAIIPLSRPNALGQKVINMTITFSEVVFTDNPNSLTAFARKLKPYQDRINAL